MICGIRSVRRECIRIYSFFPSGKVKAKQLNTSVLLDVLRESLILVSVSLLGLTRQIHYSGVASVVIAVGLFSLAQCTGS